MPKDSKRKANEIIKNNKKQSDYNPSAVNFFYTEVYPLVQSWNWKEKEREKEKTKAIKVITNADSEFRKRNSHSEKNFWVLLDEEFFNETKRSLELLKKLDKDRKNFRQNKNIKEDFTQEGLGLLSITASRWVALDKEVFDNTVKVYEEAYKEKNNGSSPLEASNEQNSNMLHIVCSVLGDISGELGIKKENWKVYQFLAKKYPHLLKEKDHLDRKPSCILEENNLRVNHENKIRYAYYVGE